MQQHFFIAIPLSDEDKQYLHNKASFLRQEHSFKKWTYKEDLHITLVFLGGSNAEQLNQCMKNVEQAVRDSGPFTLELTHFGIFGRKERPRILWCAPKFEEKLYALQRKVFDECEKQGYQLDQRGYNPHITLARKYEGDMDFSYELIQDADKMLETPYLLKVNRIVLYETKMKEVPKYHELCSVYL